MNFRKLINNRKTKPLFRKFGNLSETSIQLLVENFLIVPESLDTAKNLRDRHDVDEHRDDYDKYLSNYTQYDIQFRNIDDENIERNYKNVDDIFKNVVIDLETILGSTVCRLRYAKILKNDELGFHIDQPELDRFVMVLDGSHVAEIQTDTGIHKQDMYPGEVWYMNTNWKHRVINSGDKERIALLGCFDYFA